MSANCQVFAVYVLVHTHTPVNIRIHFFRIDVTYCTYPSNIETYTFLDCHTFTDECNIEYEYL